ncbi:MAG: dihydroorotase [Bacteroidetes bacterium]|nr:dihydroorotase [Bacteroidota bacterium]
MKSTLILNAKIVNEGKAITGDVLIKDQRIERIDKNLQHIKADETVDAQGDLLFPGVIDDQVHFREPGLTHKGNIFSESRAAVAGGVTSFMEMPNTVPPVFTQELLEQKYQIASKNSLANYSFFIGASNDNLEEVLKTDVANVCGLKIFMGSSTGNLLVDDEKTLEGFFSRFPALIAAHCEHEPTVRQNTEAWKVKFGENIPVHEHMNIRSEEACYRSSAFAVDLARKHGTKLHILHISTAKEISLFNHSLPLEKKKITAEACIHHLWFNEKDYDRLGTKIKWNPAIKTEKDQQAVFQAVLNNQIDVIATDHAPHTLEEKSNLYFNAPSGGPLVQHSLVAMLEFYHRKKISLERIAEKMCHNPSILFQIEDRGFIREGYFADLVLVNQNQPWTVSRENILAKCGWSPFEGQRFSSSVQKTWVSGNLVYADGKIIEHAPGMRLRFSR